MAIQCFLTHNPPTVGVCVCVFFFCSFWCGFMTFKIVISTACFPKHRCRQIVNVVNDTLCSLYPLALCRSAVSRTASQGWRWSIIFPDECLKSACVSGCQAAFCASAGWTPSSPHVLHIPQTSTSTTSHKASLNL